MPSMAFTPRRQAGFTLIELMITILVMAILLGVGVPSFTHTIKENRLLTETNTVINAVAQARTEALRRGKLVSICPSSDGATCAEDWGQGWIVYLEKNTVTFGEEPDVDTVLVTQQTNSGVTMQKVDGNNWMRFSGRGLAEGAITLDVKPIECETGDNYRQVVFSLTGRATYQKKKC